MSYSISIFTIDVNGTPTATVEAKWHSKADEICQGWTKYHWDELPTKGRHGSDLPPLVKVRLARADERAKYDAEDASFEYFADVKIVYLTHFDALHKIGSADHPDLH